MDEKNIWTGFDVDICRAVAAAIFGDPAKVTFMPLDASARFAALQSNRIDVLSRNSTWTMSRESSLGLMFAGIAYYDGQGFLLRRDAGIDTALQLAGKTVCTQTGTTSELNLTDYFRVNDMALKVLGLGTAEESLKAYDDRKCDVLTSDVSQLYAERLKLSAPDSHIILPEVISKEPLGPAVRQGDDQWFNLIKWTLYSLINAEELGVKSTTIDDAMKSPNPNIRRLVGTEGEFGEQLGLAKDWAARAVRAVGNYGGARKERWNAVPAQHPARIECALDPGRNSIRASREVDLRGQIMTVDYYSLLMKAVAGKDAAARDQIYKDAFSLIARSHLTRVAASSHTAALKDAVRRIEDDIAAEDANFRGCHQQGVVDRQELEAPRHWRRRGRCRHCLIGISLWLCRNQGPRHRSSQREGAVAERAARARRCRHGGPEARR